MSSRSRDVGATVARLVAWALAASSPVACIWAGTPESSTTAKEPAQGPRGVAIADVDCKEICGNPRANHCSLAYDGMHDFTVHCEGEQAKSEVGRSGVGDDCHFQMGSPNAEQCTYTEEVGDSLKAEWTFRARATFDQSRLVVHGASCIPWCGKEFADCRISSTRTAFRTDCFTPAPPSGRRPAGFELASADAAGAGRFLIASAALEAASIVAFRDLARELAAHRSPRAFVRRARRAARDEARHFRAMRDAARARKMPVARPRLERRARDARSMVELATENAVEGCVRETFGAACVLWQAERTVDAELASTLVAIARDELSHAELAWDLHRWFEKRLSPAELTTVKAAAACAAKGLSHEYPGFSGEERDVLGLPGAAGCRALLTALGETLFTPAFG